jgi:light-regulated signal transduction histidine kinase (bacteriophytochrome)
MNHLIDDLLAHARLDQQAPVLRPENLSAAVRAALAERQEDIAEIGAEICLDPVDAWVRAESHGLIQVLRNLLENALKYSAGAKPPIIAIGGAVQGDCYRLWIRDNGIGFDMAYHDRIFEIFRRLHSYEEFPGNGVGLALVKKAMERMGGKVWAESTPGNGATFFLEFALSPRKADMPQAAMC